MIPGFPNVSAGVRSAWGVDAPDDQAGHRWARSIIFSYAHTCISFSQVNPLHNPTGSALDQE